MKFQFFDHTADVGIRAWGDTLEEAFENSALAVFEVMTDTTKVERREKREVEVEGYDLENLLYRWIESLLFYYDTEILLFNSFKVSIEGLRLRGEAFGERFDPERHERRTVVKAMTYHEMRITKRDGGYEITFVVDI